MILPYEIFARYLFLMLHIASSRRRQAPRHSADFAWVHGNDADHDSGIVCIIVAGHDKTDAN